jgi:hypothetical protein
MQKEGRMDMRKLLAAFRNFFNALKKDLVEAGRAWTG